jgi:hypothetical protein
LIDSDPARFAVKRLLEWKKTAEAEARAKVGRAANPPTADGGSICHILIPGPSPLPTLAGPAALLNARHEIVPFHGRVEVLEDLRGWCEGKRLTAVRLIHGPGGMGKTRLLIELCRQMREKGWLAGFIPKRLEPARFTELVSSQRSTLAVIDYAESHPSLRGLLSAMFQGRTRGGESRMRVVLISRTKNA